MTTQPRLRKLVEKLLARAESDEAFARSAIAVLERVMSPSFGKLFGAREAAELSSFEPKEFVAEHGQEALRKFLKKFRVDELREYAKERHLANGGVSRLSKGDIINRIVVSTRNAA